MEEIVSLWENGPTFVQAEHFRLGTDSVLLADFVRCGSARRGIDLGCASGILSLLLLVNNKRLHMTGLELVPAAVELARENMARNALTERSTMLCGDIRAHRELFRSGEFDLVAANPPYFAKDSGVVSPSAERASARAELCCDMEELCAAAAYLSKTGGSVYFVHRPERLSELMSTMSAKGVEPKRLRLVCHRADAAPSLVLVEGRRGGRPGLRIEPILCLQNADGSETDELRRIYHR